MKICDRAVNMFQVINAEGDCRVCGWPKNNYVGNLLKEDINSIMHGEKAECFRNTILDGTYSNCSRDNCPYLANETMDEIIIELDEIPKYPRELWLAYEGVCNYNCTCCSSYLHMEDTKKNDYTEKYERLEEELRKILPYVKTISANGRGELFVSTHILNLLSEWKPIAPENEIKVMLETNGSLFDEKHWKQIENLGKYNVEVAITIMSFNEPIYQYLSGTKLPISRIENNLRYVKKLREEGVINTLEIATVLQEANFREMPEFTRRCIEEFGADRVRIRPIFIGGRYDINIQWFMDVRNPEHPYYEQYLNVMKHPIFKHPKVLLWSGDLKSSIGEHPEIKNREIKKIVNEILNKSDFIDKLQAKLGDGNVSLYGIGTIGKLLLNLNQGAINVDKIYDNFSSMKFYKEIPVMKSSDDIHKSGKILVTVYKDYQNIKQKLHEEGFFGEIIDFYSILEEIK